MGIDQPFGDEPASEDDYLINETSELEETQEELRYASWEFEATEIGGHKGRAISRGSESIRLMVLEADEYEQFEEGNEYWTEEETSTGTSVSFAERLSPGDYVLIAAAPADTGGKKSEVTAQVWKG